MLLKIFVFPWSKLVINVSGFRVFVWCKCYFYQITEWLVMKAIWGSLIVLEVSEVNIPQKRELNVCFFSLMKYLWYLSLSYTSKENLSHLCHSTLYRESSDS